MKKSKILLGILSVVVLFSACTDTDTDKDNVDRDNVAKDKVAEDKLKFQDYPIDSDQEITYWMSMNPNLTSLYSDFGETPFAQELEKRTGVKVKYVHPAVGQEAQSLSLMIASGQMTDLIEYNWSVYQGGPDISIQNETIAPLNTIFKKNAPNLSKYLEENPDIARATKTDDGYYYVFPFIREDKIQLRSSGLMIRHDWLQELGLETPKTVDELEKVLIAFKDKKGATAPLSWGPFGHFYFMQMLGANFNYYIKDGEVVFGPMEPEFKRACETLAKWYKMGLLDKNIVSIDTKMFDANILNDKTGVTVAGGGNLGKWLDVKAGKKFDMVGIPDLVDENGENLEFVMLESNYEGNGVAISATSKNKALAARFMDYGYSDDGYMLYNFGIEGLTYEMKDGVPVYTDEIKKNPDGLPMTQAMAKYFRSSSSSGPFIQSEYYLTEYYYRPQQRESLKNWLKSYEKGVKVREPKVTFTAEEAEEFAELTVELDKVVDETFISLVLGTKSFNEYDEFIDTLKKLNVDRAIELKATAVERYNNRK